MRVGVHLGDDDTARERRVVAHRLAQLLVFGREVLAVAAPGRVEFDERIAGAVDVGVESVGVWRKEDGKRQSKPRSAAALAPPRRRNTHSSPAPASAGAGRARGGPGSRAPIPLSSHPSPARPPAARSGRSGQPRWRPGPGGTGRASWWTRKERQEWGRGAAPRPRSLRGRAMITNGTQLQVRPSRIPWRAASPARGPPVRPPRRGAHPPPTPPFPPPITPSTRHLRSPITRAPRLPSASTRQGARGRSGTSSQSPSSAPSPGPRWRPGR